MALVIVLAMLVLLTGLVVAFFSAVTGDSGSSAIYSNDERSKQLSESAVNLVMGQIIEATKGFKTSGGASDYTQPLAWASQPGAIRTFDNSGTAGNVFKLYSAQSLVESGSGNFTTDVPSTWAADNATFTDLNAPVQNAAGAAIYPIVDPTALGSVEGFSITGAPTTGTTNAAPMPVRWLYQLKDGTLAVSTGNGTTANVAAATADNPIVGRIAFWTDDETCKVNINTASEGTYWDTPRFGASITTCPFDYNLAQAQPVQHEFQRYPGHPSMTSLAPVFFATSATVTGTLTLAQRNAIYNVSPRIVGGGSDGGSTITASASNTSIMLNLKKDRLYASVDELMFSWQRYLQDSNAGITTDSIRKRAFFLTASSRAPEVTLFNTPRVSIWPTSSNATDSLSRPLRTAFDNVIRFCSSLGVDSTGNPLLYAFQRRDSKSSTADWTNITRNRQILLYLQRLTAASNPIPGFGGSFETKLTARDRDQLLVEILDYVRCTNMFDDNLSPNTYSNQATPPVQFTFGRDLYACQGFSFVTPLRVPSDFGTTVPASTAAAPDQTSYMGFGRYNTITEAGLLFICNADGSAGTTAAPIDSPSKADGYDPIRRLSNQAADVAAVAPAPALVKNKALGNMTLTPTQKRVQAMILFKSFCPSAGYMPMAADYFIEIEQVGGKFAVQGQDLGIPTGTLDVNVSADYNNGVTLGGVASYKKPLMRKYLPARGCMPADSSTGYRFGTYEFVGAPVTIDTTLPMTFTGPTKLVVRLFRGTKATPGDLMQTIEMNFPSTDFPIPDLVTVGTANGNNQGGNAYIMSITTVPQDWWTFHIGGAVSGFTGRVNYTQDDTSANSYSPSAVREGNLIRPEDTLRTLVPYHGDYRLLAGSHCVPLGVFQPSLYYFNGSNDRTGNPKALPPVPLSGTSVNISPDFWTGPASTQTGSNMASNDNINHATSASAGNWGFYFPPASQRLVTGANYLTQGYEFPEIPVFTLNGSATYAASAYQLYGDFDNPLPVLADGPYINKPDEGNLVSAGTPYYNPPNVYSIPMTATFFTPARIMPGPGMFGSLPVKLWSGNTAYAATNPGAWRTLLFRTQAGHLGAAAPADHLLMDLFWMPVVEPYAISDPLSTAGKINMNYAMAPFSYIRRATGIVSALRSEQVIVVPLAKANAYKGTGSSSAATPTYRQPIDENETLKGFDARFAAASGPNIFLSPSEICTLDLIPTGSTYPLSSTFWSATNSLTGDNSRERPYTTLQPRLTTKSNTFTVHYRVQVLKKVPGTSANQWVEGKDIVASEARGSTLIERYVDPNDPDIPDFATRTGGNSSRFPSLNDRMNIDNYYRFRIVQSRKFAP